MDNWDANTSIDLNKGNKKIMFKKASHNICIAFVNSMKVIKSLTNRTIGSIKPIFIVEYFPVMALSSVASYSVLIACIIHNDGVVIKTNMITREMKGLDVKM